MNCINPQLYVDKRRKTVKKIVAATLVLTFLFGGVAFAAAKKKPADPAKAECTAQAKKEGISKKKMGAYVKECVAAKKK